MKSSVFLLIIFSCSLFGHPNSSWKYEQEYKQLKELIGEEKFDDALTLCYEILLDDNISYVDKEPFQETIHIINLKILAKKKEFKILEKS